jgi:hypothetical protein
MPKHLLVRAALGVSLVTAIVAAPSTAFAANPSSGAPPTVPQVASATAGGAWLESQFNSSGYIPVSGSPDQADLSATANAVLALASVGDDAVALNGLNYLSQNVDAYVVDQNNSDLPGSLALLILDTHALGADPTSFGGTNLVARLLATQQTSGTYAGMFGTDAQFDNYAAGGFIQGLALSGLAAAGIVGTTQATGAVDWLLAEQCPNGGWNFSDNSDDACAGDPADYAGPDTNSTSQAIQGLSAEGGLTAEATSLADKFVKSSQNSDGGWGYEPNAPDNPGNTSDPDSTAEVIQAILALGKSPSSAVFSKGGANPVATLLAFQLTSGSGSGAFTYPGSPDPNLVATYEAVPAVAGVDQPFNLFITTSSLPGGTVYAKHAAKYSAQLTASGGSAPYTWKLVSGSGTLPAGLKLSHSTGVISGKPTTAGTSSFAVEMYAAPSPSAPQTEAISWKELSITTAPAT